MEVHPPTEMTHLTKNDLARLMYEEYHLFDDNPLPWAEADILDKTCWQRVAARVFLELKRDLFWDDE